MTIHVVAWFALVLLFTWLMLIESLFGNIVECAHCRAPLTIRILPRDLPIAGRNVEGWNRRGIAPGWPAIVCQVYGFAPPPTCIL